MYLINGKFLEHKITGVERFAGELIVRLDGMMEKGMACLAVSQGARNVPELKNIDVVRVGRHKGNVWEQLELPFYAMRHGCVLVNLCNAAPLLKPDITCIHDIQPRVSPQFFRKMYVLWALLNLENVFRRAKAVITVSRFSKSEFEKYFRPRMPVYVIYNSWEHENRIEADMGIFEKLPVLKNKNFYFAMSSMAPNKNVSWIVETARLNPDKYFVVSGNVNRKIFGRAEGTKVAENFIFAGYVSDGEAKAMMSYCRAFLFPTFYEGFGIPPMEAMCCGADVMVSDRSCMREIYGDAVAYIDPDKPCGEIDNIVFPEKEKGRKLLAAYSWEKSARRLLEVLEKHGEQRKDDGKKYRDSHRRHK